MTLNAFATLGRRNRLFVLSGSGRGCLDTASDFAQSRFSFYGIRPVLGLRCRAAITLRDFRCGIYDVKQRTDHITIAAARHSAASREFRNMQ
jgi:hypothetical protein